MKSLVSIRKTLDLNIEMSVRELAEAFAGLAGDEQAQFFAEVAAIFRSWGGARACMQCHYAAEHVKGDARWLIEEIAGSLR